MDNTMDNTMKRKETITKIISISALFILMYGITLAGDTESVQGIWLGDLEVEPGKVLNIAIVFSEKEDNTLGALFKINGQGDLPIDEIKIDNNKIKLEVKAAPFTIEGTIDSENETIKSELHQVENNLPLILKRVKELPEK